MRSINILLFIFLPFVCFSQINETFSNGNFTDDPVWEGMTENFIVNSDFQLQSNAPASSRSFLFTPSRSINNAVWETWVRVNYHLTSANNHTAIYIIADRPNALYVNGYYVQIGGNTTREIALYLQQGTRRTRIVGGAPDRYIAANPFIVNIKVTRDAYGNFELFSRINDEEEFTLEGRAQNTAVTQTYYFGVFFANTATTGNRYLFDDIFVSGEKNIDTEPPVWTSLAIQEPNKLLLEFDKPIDVDNAEFFVDNGIGFARSVQVLSGKRSMELEFFADFEAGIVYTLEVTGLTNLDGYALTENRRIFGIAGTAEYGDLRFNEIMFNSPENSVGYIELINASDKILDISGFALATRRADGSLTSGVRIPAQTLMLPNSIIAFCSDAEMLRRHHNAPPEANIVTTASWTNLNNTSATLVLTDPTQEIIFDELTYNARWHHPLIRNARGVALERISPFLPTQSADSWHSASSLTNYGTPGWRNSQFREINSTAPDHKFVWLDPEVFSPDGSGFNNVCFIHYRTDEIGYAANVIIYNALGVQVRRIAANELLSTEGFFIWDGTTDAGKNANVGIYVLFFEKFNVSTGQRKQAKLPLVVSAR